MRCRRAVDADRAELAAFAEPLQARPDRHITYLGVDAATIAAELLAEDDDWTAVSAVAEVDDQLIGWLTGSVDEQLGRVWWYGPFVVADRDARWKIVADELRAHALALLPTSVDEEELAPDARFALLREWAEASGFHGDPGSVVLTLDGGLPPPSSAIRPVAPGDAAVVAALHDELFPGTHTTGRQLVDGADARHVRLVAELGGGVAGYVAVERQPDGDGYLDFLGVAPRWRHRGLGADLVRAGVGALVELGCRRQHLTVREANAAARRLYAGLGFREERVITPYRRGFTLP